MIMKMICNNSDFSVTYKRLTVFFGSLSILGVLGLVCYFLFVTGSTLDDFVQGVYMGVSIGLLLASLIGLFRLYRLKKDPKAWKKAAIQHCDEREQAIIAHSMQSAWFIQFLFMTAALLIVLPFSMEAFQALFAAYLLSAASFFLSNLYYSKKL